MNFMYENNDRSEVSLRYGCNPHQVPARIYAREGSLPFTVLNGVPGYVNLLDALNGWQLVRELRRALDLPSAASFKHVSPAGAAVACELTPALRKAYFVGERELSPLATAYVRARGADPMSSFGDWAAFSDRVDAASALILKREVSDGIIAPDFDGKALDILKKKKLGTYPVIRVDPAYDPSENETREVFGLCLEQKRNDAVIDKSILKNIVTREKELPPPAVRDLLIATITLKYTQSNSVCFAFDGQVIGVGAGQQSRIHCTRLAAEKAETWFLRQHPAVMRLKFREKVKRQARINAIQGYLHYGEMTEQEKRAWVELFEVIPKPLHLPEITDETIPGSGYNSKTGAGNKKERSNGISLSSDAFIPFRDNIDRAARAGVKYIIQTGGSLRDEEVIRAADEYGMVMIFSGLRLFHH